MSSQRLWMVALSALAGVTLVACLRGTGKGSEDSGGDGGRVWAQLGLSDMDTLEYTPLEDGADLPLGTFGQGGHHVALAVACEGFGTSAYVEVTITNLDGEGEAVLPPFTKPQLLLCDDGPCRFAALYVMTGGLADPDMLDGLHVRIDATVDNGGSLKATDSITGYLRLPAK